MQVWPRLGPGVIGNGRGEGRSGFGREIGKEDRLQVSGWPLSLSLVGRIGGLGMEVGGCEGRAQKTVIVSCLTTRLKVQSRRSSHARDGSTAFGAVCSLRHYYCSRRRDSTRFEQDFGMGSRMVQFEWAWQHPTESLAVRKAASSFKSLSGLTNKIKLAYTMLNLPSWENLNLTVNFFSTKYTKHLAGCPRLPNQMSFNICTMDDLPCYVEGHALHCSNDVYDEADGEEDINEDINIPASADVTIEGMSRNINQMGNTVSYNCEQTLQTEKPKKFPEFLESNEECYGNLSSNSRILLELSEFNELSQSPRRVIECRRHASTSLSPNSCSGDSGMEQARQKSTPRCSNNEAMTSSLLISPKVDVINLCTPSSGIIRSKTKRALFDSMIIDLTDSPMVIQL